jgi:hypothetical protein
VSKFIAVEEVDIDSLTPYPGNARRGQVEKIRESLRKNGQYRTIVVRDEDRLILAGNHTWMAAKEEGAKKIRVERWSCTEDEARRIVLVDNKLNDDASYNDEALVNLLKSLDGDYEGTGFDGDDLSELLERLGDDDWAGALASLGGEKGEYVTMSFTLHESQKDSVKEAMDIATTLGDFDEEINTNKNGNALARVAELFLHEHKTDHTD